MGAVGPERQRLFPEHGIERQIGEQMREEIAAPRRLPFQRFAKDGRVDRHQQQVGFAGKMQRAVSTAWAPVEK